MQKSFFFQKVYKNILNALSEDTKRNFKCMKAKYGILHEYYSLQNIQDLSKIVIYAMEM